jgi:ribosomal protein S18 acetylase RimI-like enzyme
VNPTFSTLQLRPESPQDEAFLFELYASTRQEELDSWGWPPALRAGFLQMQFKASQGYQASFPQAEFQIILLNGQVAGRLVVNRTPEELRVVDFALVPERRNAGLGSTVLQRVIAEAAAARKPIRLRVLKGNRAQRFYERLGFVCIGESELHREMEWRAPDRPTGAAQ